MSTPSVERDGAASRSRGRRRFRLLIALVIPLLLGGCDLPNFLGFRGSSSQGYDEHLLWAGTFIAALVVGGIVTVLILWSVVRYRRRSDEIPRQFQYHTVFEVAYTIIPVVIVLILFGFTVVVENRVDATGPPAYQTVDVYAFQWGWQFKYAHQDVTVEGETVQDPDPIGLDGARCAPSADCLGPGLVVPVGKEVLIELRSKDTIHGFYVPEFNFSRYAQPGILNSFEIDANHVGIYRAQCTQFCGLYHSQMFFHVVALPPAQFQAWLRSERANSPNRPSSTTLSNSSTYSSGLHPYHPSSNGAAA